MKRQCKKCGNDYTTDHPSRISKYCSLNCKTLDLHPPVLLKCPTCDTLFRVRPADIRRRKRNFCSKNCYYNYSKVANV